MIEIVTMRFGKKYGPEYARRLYQGVARNLTRPFHFTVFTDDATPLHPDIRLQIRPDLGGWWNHLWAFSAWTSYRQMLIDVDDVVVGSLDELAAYYGPHAINSDVYAPHNVDGGFQLIPPHLAHLQKLYIHFIHDVEALEAIRQRYHSDKEFYVAHINDTARVEDLFPGQWVSFKEHCRNGLPANARIVGFHGQPKPADLPADHVIRQLWEAEEVSHAAR